MIPKALIGVIAISSLTMGAVALAAENRCAIEPFTTTLHQGESASVTVNISVDTEKETVDMRMGNLPNFVEGGFDKNIRIEPKDLIASSKILIHALPSAQIGSFMMPVEYTISGKKPAICQFGLTIIKGETKAGDTSSIQSQIVSRTTDMNFFQKIWSWLVRLFSKTK
jgi:hypothetical protein